LFSCSTPYTKTTKQESFELEPTTEDIIETANREQETATNRNTPEKPDSELNVADVADRAFI